MKKEKRKNWKEEISQAAMLRQQKRNKLLAEKDEIAQQIRQVNIRIDPQHYDDLKQKQREIIAALATI